MPINYIETRTVQDKSDWKSGQWQSEADYYYWIDEKTAKNCLIVRNTFGCLCGYVGLTRTHKFYGLHYNEIEDELDYETSYGGLTYSESCNDVICHQHDGDDITWWVGFDTSHSEDLMPNYDGFTFDASNQTYKDVEFVVKEVEKLATTLTSLQN